MQKIVGEYRVARFEVTGDHAGSGKNVAEYLLLPVRVFVNETPSEEEFERTNYPNIEGRPAVIVVGAGPGGLFAALKLIELGLRPIVIERGKNVRERKEDLARISREHKVDAESNYSFGEGGAQCLVRLV